MIYLVVSMLVILVVAGLVVVYAAYPHRGENVPGMPWLGEAMGKAADAVPTIDEDEGESARLR